jgi:hypothetical protein
MKKTVVVLFCAIFSAAAAAGVQAAEIVVTGPAAGAVWAQGREHTITWTATGRMDANVKINLRQGSRVIQSISSSVPAAAGRFTWTVTATLANGTYYVRVKTLDNVVQGDSGAFTIGPETVAELHPAPTATLRVMPTTKTLTMPVTFHTKYKHKDRHSWNCLATMGMGPGDLPPTEFMVGFFNRCADRGPGCADECISEIYRASPLRDAVRLRTLVGKTMIKATLSFRHKKTECNVPAWTQCLSRVLFYSGRMGEANPPPCETRILAVSISGTYQIDVTGMMSNWLREKGPDYHGELHNYLMEFVGVNEAMDYNDQKCLSWFDSGNLEIKYRD